MLMENAIFRHHFLLFDSKFYDEERKELVFVPRRYFFCGSFMVFFCLVFAMPLCASVCMCLVVTGWERADLFALDCGV